jgi:hypothetical protein
MQLMENHSPPKHYKISVHVLTITATSIRDDASSKLNLNRLLDEVSGLVVVG